MLGRRRGARCCHSLQQDKLKHRLPKTTGSRLRGRRATVITLGWDIGGAHIKAARCEHGRLVAVRQLACPLWQGLSHLHAGFEQLLQEWPDADRHALTMTGELADIFPDRHAGVVALLDTADQHLVCRSSAGVDRAPLPWQVFSAVDGLINASDASARQPQTLNAIASANWLASATLVAQRLPQRQGILIDIGSTTTDLIAVDDRQVLSHSGSDAERLAQDQLVYNGATRTPLCALAARAPFAGRWQHLCAEWFATSADVYRLLGLLPADADQLPSADGREKTLAASRARLARVFGRDAADASDDDWQKAAQFFADRQLAILRQALQRQLSRAPAQRLDAAAPLIGAGCGRFLVAQLASQLQRPYVDFSTLLSAKTLPRPLADAAATSAPAAALACLAYRGFDGCANVVG